MLCVYLACAFLLGCQPPDQFAAVELSWFLRPRSTCDSGDPTDTSCATCESARISQIELYWDVPGYACPEDNPNCTTKASWPCDDRGGSTAFIVPPGDALLRVIPACQNGFAQLGTYTSPAPFVRQTLPGEVVALGAMIIAVENAQCTTVDCVCE